MALTNRPNDRPAANQNSGRGIVAVAVAIATEIAATVQRRTCFLSRAAIRVLQRCRLFSFFLFFCFSVFLFFFFSSRDRSSIDSSKKKSTEKTWLRKTKVAKDRRNLRERGRCSSSSSATIDVDVFAREFKT